MAYIDDIDNVDVPVIERSKEKYKKNNQNRSEHNDFVLIESDEHKYLLALYHAIHKEKEEASPENQRSAMRALTACNLFYLG